MDITQILLRAQSADRATRVEAENVLAQASNTNFSNFLTTLSSHLSLETANPESRRLAGIIIKNNLSSHTPSIAKKHAIRWIEGVTPPSKVQIHRDLLKTLSSVVSAARRAAAQVIATLSTIELPIAGQWDDLIETLLRFCLAGESSDVLRQSSLETLGFICEEASFSESNGDGCAKALEGQSNSILNAVVGNMSYTGSDEKSATVVRHSATVALNNALEFAKKNFNIDSERHAIMRKLYEAAKAPEENIRQVAFEGLVRVAECYYEHLFEYITGIHDISVVAIKSDAEPVALQAIEFWSTVADEEMALADEAQALRDIGSKPTQESKFFIKSAVPTLVGPLFECLKMQNEDPLDDETWNRATAAGACLESFAGAAPLVILEPVIAFVEQNLKPEASWRAREAALLAFGMVLESPPREVVRTFVEKAFEVVIIHLVQDPNPAVQDTAAWTLGRMIKISRVVTEANLPNIAEGLRLALSKAQSPIVAGHVCFAIHNLAETFMADADASTGALTNYTEVILRELLNASGRDDASEGHLRVSAYEALNMIFRAAAGDSLGHISSCVPVLLEKLEQSIQAGTQAFTEDDAMEIAELQGLLCSALTTATQKLRDVGDFADRLMTCYMKVLTSRRSGSVAEEALLAGASVADALQEHFLTYLPHFMPVVIEAMKDHEQTTLCSVAVGVVGDLSRSMGKLLRPYTKDIMIRLLDALQSDVLEKTVKPPILSCLGDLALGIKGGYAEYVSEVMPRLKQAAERSIDMKVESDDYDAQEFLVTLKEAIFEGYVGTIHGLQEDNKQHLLSPYVEWMVLFCEAIMKQEASGTAPAVGLSVLGKSIVGVLGDLGHINEDAKREIAKREWVKTLFDVGSNSDDVSFRESAEWARRSIFG